VHGLGVAAIVAAGVALVSALLAIRMPRRASITAVEGQQPKSEAAPVPPPAAPAPQRAAA
jgi:hypothetical protein